MVPPQQPKKYQIIYADPAWRYNDKSLNRGGAERHYPTMAIEDMCALPVAKMAHDDCALLMWGTWPKLFDADGTSPIGRLICAWGFEYKTCAFVWVKTNKKTETEQMMMFPSQSFANDEESFLGMGRYSRSNTEFCLLAMRGRLERKDCGVRQIIYHPIMEHSRKPDETRDRIVSLFGDLPRIEMFCRHPASGWDVWGNEVKSNVKL